MKEQWLRCIGRRVCGMLCWAAVTQPLYAQTAQTPADAVTSSSLAQVLPAELRPAWRKTRLPDTALSLVVQEIGGPQLLVFDADTPRNPASVMKLVTTWLALSELGPQHVWRTALLTDPGARPDDDGALAAPLYLRAGGDPMLHVKDLWALLHALRLRGVRRLGDVVVDRSLFGPVAIDPGAFDGAADRPYNASPDALVVGFGAVQLAFLPDPAQKRWRVLIDPPVSGVTLAGAPQWRDGRCTGQSGVTTEVVTEVATALATESTPTAQGVTLRIQGHAAGACGEFSLYRLALTQPRFAAEVLRYLWQQLGGEMTGQVRAGQIPVDAVRLVEHESPPLGEVIRAVNKLSNNLMARLLLLSLGAKQNPTALPDEAIDTPVTLPASREAARVALAAQGLHMPELVLENGAGLSRAGRISANSLTRLLTRAWQSPWMPEYLASLAIVGVDGTVSHRLRHSPAAGRAHLKTGSLRDVRALAGYVQNVRGKRYIVVSLVNHDQAHAAQSFEDALIAWLTQRLE